MIILIKGPYGDFPATWDGEAAKCRGPNCGAEIGWALTKNGKKLPFNLDNVGQHKDGRLIYEPHWGTCVGEDRFR